MALAAVVALIPLFYIATGDISRYYFGRHLWFGYFAVYGIILHVTQMPWSDILQDFQCHGNLTYFCVTECFEKFFNVPVTGIWYYVYFVCMGLFFLYEFFLAIIQPHEINDKLVESKGIDEGEGSKEKSPSPTKSLKSQEKSPSPTKSLKFYREKTPSFSYLIYLLLVMLAQCLFSFFLLYKHLPLVSQSTIRCSADYCPGNYLCLIRGTVEKQYSVYTLIVLTFITILFCMGFSLHNVYHYISKKI